MPKKKEVVKEVKKEKTKTLSDKIYEVANVLSAPPQRKVSIQTLYLVLKNKGILKQLNVLREELQKLEKAKKAICIGAEVWRAI